MNATMESEMPASPDLNDNLIDAVGVSVTFGSQTILKDITLSIRRGETAAIIGESCLRSDEIGTSASVPSIACVDSCSILLMVDRCLRRCSHRWGSVRSLRLKRVLVVC